MQIPYTQQRIRLTLIIYMLVTSEDLLQRPYRAIVSSLLYVLRMSH